MRNWACGAGLITPRDLICLHIDRFLQLPTGRLCKSKHRITFAGVVDIPIWQNNQELRWEPYQMTAAFAHLGDECSGHYQALLRLHHNSRHHGTPAFWLHCDDGRAPVPCAAIPPNFESGITCVWLCKCDRTQLYRLPDDHDMPTTDTHPTASSATLLSMLGIPLGLWLLINGL